MWSLLPPAAQHEKWRANRSKMQEKLAYLLYLDILKEIVGDLWVSGILAHLDEEDLGVIMPIPDYASTRKQISNNVGRGLSLWKYL